KKKLLATSDVHFIETETVHLVQNRKQRFFFGRTVPIVWFNNSSSSSSNNNNNNNKLKI
ncbi:hypothetical protein ACJX0J_009623, partial [Zea mays]